MWVLSFLPLLLLPLDACYARQSRFEPLAAPCVEQELAKYPECDILRNLSRQAEPPSLDQIKVVCEVCITTVHHFLALDDLLVCKEFLQWASTTSSSCAQTHPTAVVCPQLSRDPDCHWLADNKADSWGDSPPRVYALPDLQLRCVNCRMYLSATKLTACPLERKFKEAIEPFCNRMVSTVCLAGLVEGYYGESGGVCESTISMWQQVGVAVSPIVKEEVCGRCLPSLLDSWEAIGVDACADGGMLAVNHLKLWCTGQAVRECVPTILSKAAGCSSMTSQLLGVPVSIPRAECTACLAAARRVYTALIKAEDRTALACSQFDADMASLEEQCSADGFVVYRCQTLFAWLRGNHSLASPTATMSGSLSVTLPEYDELAKVPCADPRSCTCMRSAPRGFLNLHRYQLASCGIVPSDILVQCDCNEIREAFQSEVPECRDIFGFPNLPTLCDRCAPHLTQEAAVLRLQEYDTCTGKDEGALLSRGIRAMCAPSGMGSGPCVSALLQGLDLLHCSGAFATIVLSALRGTVPRDDALADILCFNGTRCTTQLERFTALTNSLSRSCGMDLVPVLPSCKCWGARKAFLAAQPQCAVLEYDQWDDSAVNFTRLCQKCLPGLVSSMGPLQAYGSCMGKRDTYAIDLRGTVQAICDVGLDGARELSGGMPVVESSCQLPPSAGCTARVWCDAEVVAPCGMVARMPHWQVVPANRILVCMECVAPLLRAYRKSELRHIFANMAACSPDLAPREIALACQSVIDICPTFPELCPAPHPLPLCAVEVEAQGEEWSRCSRDAAREGGDLCRCEGVFQRDVTATCQVANTSLWENWLCAVRPLGCPAIPYPSGGESACKHAKDMIGWDGGHITSGWALCPPDTLKAVFVAAAACAEDCLCVEKALGDAPLDCRWDVPGLMLEQLTCYHAVWCTALAKTHPTSRCHAVAAEAEDTAMCIADMAALVEGSLQAAEGCTECSCLRNTTQLLSLFPQCLRGRVEWETLRCVVHELRCEGRAAPPDHPYLCQRLVGVGSVAAVHLHHPAFFPDRSVPCLLPELDFSCMSRGSREGKCRCLAAASYRIPLSCAFPQGGLHSDHIRCLAAALRCVTIPPLPEVTCAAFYLGHLHTTGSAYDTSSPSQLPAKLSNVPPGCRSSDTAAAVLRGCQAGLLRSVNTMHNAVEDLQRGLCDCYARALQTSLNCSAYQPAAHEDLLCSAARMGCTAPTPTTECNSDLLSHRSPPSHPECLPLFGHLRRLSTLNPSSTKYCEKLANTTLAVPYRCRTGATGEEYQYLLCLAVRHKCPLPAVPSLPCPLLLDQSPDTVHSRRGCREQLALLAAEPTCRAMFLTNPRERVALKNTTLLSEMCNGPCGSQLRVAMLRWPWCSEEERLYLSWADTVCRRVDEKYCIPEVVAFEEGHVRHVQILPVPREAAVFLKVSGMHQAEAFLGRWEGAGIPELFASLDRPGDFPPMQLCTKCFVAATRALQGHREMQEHMVHCVHDVVPRAGYEEKQYCVDRELSWDWSTSGGIRSICQDRCFKKMVRALVAHRPRQREEEERKLEAMCKADLVGGLCQAPGSPSPHVEQCGLPLAAFQRCVRGRYHDLCHCLLHLDTHHPDCIRGEFAPRTVCLLHPLDDWCYRSNYSALHSQTCRDETCAELTWHKAMQCSQDCAKAMIWKAEDLGCCAAPVASLLHSWEPTMDLADALARCGIPLDDACPPPAVTKAFEGRVVVSDRKQVILSRPLEYAAALSADLAEMLQLREEIRGLKFEGVNFTVALDHPKHTLTRGFRTLEATTVQVEARFLLAGATERETNRLRGEFHAALGDGLYLPRTAVLFLQDTGAMLVVNTYLSSVEGVLPMASFTDDFPAPVASPEDSTREAATGVQFRLGLLAVAVALYLL